MIRGWLLVWVEAGRWILQVQREHLDELLGRRIDHDLALAAALAGCLVAAPLIALIVLLWG